MDIPGKLIATTDLGHLLVMSKREDATSVLRQVILKKVLIAIKILKILTTKMNQTLAKDVKMMMAPIPLFPCIMMAEAAIMIQLHKMIHLCTDILHAITTKTHRKKTINTMNFIIPSRRQVKNMDQNRTAIVRIQDDRL